MGIHGLTKLIADNAPHAIKENKLDNYFGRKIAIDASMSIYQFLIAVRSGGDLRSADLSSVKSTDDATLEGSWDDRSAPVIDAFTAHDSAETEGLTVGDSVLIEFDQSVDSWNFDAETKGDLDALFSFSADLGADLGPLISSVVSSAARATTRSVRLRRGRAAYRGGGSGADGPADGGA